MATRDNRVEPREAPVVFLAGLIAVATGVGGWAVTDDPSWLFFAVVGAGVVWPLGFVEWLLPRRAPLPCGMIQVGGRNLRIAGDRSSCSDPGPAPRRTAPVTEIDAIAITQEVAAAAGWEWRGPVRARREAWYDRLNPGYLLGYLGDDNPRPWRGRSWTVGAHSDGDYFISARIEEDTGRVICASRHDTISPRE